MKTKLNPKLEIVLVAALLVAIVIGAYFAVRPQSEPASQRFSESAILDTSIPLEQVVIYRSRSDYSPFRRAVFAQGQLPCPSGLSCSLYVEANKINGPIGLAAVGKRCNASQSFASYNQDTISMDKRFCPDFNDAILEGTPYADIAPTEAVFIHRANGERCVNGNEYFINPADLFFRDYLIRRTAQKLEQHKLDTVFLDDLRPGWKQITTACGGAPKEYSSSAAYYDKMVELGQYVYDNLAARVEGNIDVAGSHWNRYTHLDGAMCESCFSNWGGSWPSSSRMISDLAVLQGWVNSGKTLYVIVYPPDVSEASNRFTFAAALLVAEPGKMYFHFGDSGSFHPLEDYKLDLGNPVGLFSCVNSVCTREFERGRVTVDFTKRTGVIQRVSESATETGTATVTATMVPTATPTITSAPICVLVYSDRAELCK